MYNTSTPNVSQRDIIQIIHKDNNSPQFPWMTKKTLNYPPFPRMINRDKYEYIYVNITTETNTEDDFV